MELIEIEVTLPRENIYMFISLAQFNVFDNLGPHRTLISFARAARIDNLNANAL